MRMNTHTKGQGAAIEAIKTGKNHTMLAKYLEWVEALMGSCPNHMRVLERL